MYQVWYVKNITEIGLFESCWSKFILSKDKRIEEINKHYASLHDIKQIHWGAVIAKYMHIYWEYWKWAQFVNTLT